jgi:50S ribosomal subunit-associated GTPase HflX
VCEISARTGAGIDLLLRQVATLLAAQQEKLRIRIPIDRPDLIAALHRSGRVVEEVLEDGEDGYRVTAFVPPVVAGRIRKELGRPC